MAATQFIFVICGFIMPVQADQGDEYAFCCPDAPSLPGEGIDSPQYVLVQLQNTHM